MTTDLNAAMGRNDVELGKPANAAERDTLGTILGLCFGIPEADLRALLEAQDMDPLVVLRHGGEVVGGLILIDMGQHFGGRSVPMCGVAAVGIAPERRGEGFGRALVRGSVAYMASRGAVLSALYPATVPLYRSGGYELAGQRFEHELPLDSWTQRSGELSVRPGTTDDYAEMERAQSAAAREHDGTLDRGDYIWQRVRSPRGDTSRHYLVEGSDGLGAYLSLRQPKRTDGHIGYDLVLTDLVVREHEAGQRLLAFLSTHASLAGKVTLHGAAHPELLGLLSEWRPSSRLFMPWMNRVLDLPAVLRARGYAPGLSAEVSLRLNDDLCDAHTGNWILRVADGVAQVEPGGNGEIELSERGAAAVFGGFSTPRAAARQGLLHGPPESLDRLGALFAGNGPWMMEMF
ncbi:MAG: hypothetical protein DHS20C15_12630 [Planctomycetota bacterium]|nr:MAG: hypothetical protein DHS20C15_12630 [Planctomycetota bacterium]